MRRDDEGVRDSVGKREINMLNTYSTYNNLV